MKDEGRRMRDEDEQPPSFTLHPSPFIQRRMPETYESYYRGRRVLVTGANGFIGAWLVAMLVDLGAEVTGYDLADEGALSLHAGLRGKVGLVLGQCTEQDKLEQALRE